MKLIKCWCWECQQETYQELYYWDFVVDIFYSATLECKICKSFNFKIVKVWELKNETGS